MITMLSRLLQVWEIAAKDLGFEIVVPYLLTLPSGIQINAQFLVQNFGAVKGMLIVGSYDEVECCLDELMREGYGFSVLDEPGKSERYERRDYIELLNDWGWGGDDKDKPDWVL